MAEIQKGVIIGCLLTPLRPGTAIGRSALKPEKKRLTLGCVSPPPLPKPGKPAVETAVTTEYPEPRIEQADIPPTVQYVLNPISRLTASNRPI